MVIITAILDRFGVDAIERALRRVYGAEAHIENTSDHPGEVWVRPMSSLRPRDAYFYRWKRIGEDGSLWICEFYIDSTHGEATLSRLVSER
jgi:hypothetical protein